MIVQLSKFSLRHFDPKFGGTKILGRTPDEFIEKVNNDYLNEFMLHNIAIIRDGYMDDCKLLFITNFTDAKTGTMPITLENYQYLRSGYSARTENELPVLSRWFELPNIPDVVPKAEYLCLVLYSKKHMEKERDARGEEEEFTEDWIVVAILGQMHDEEEPMQPATMMRNALGMEQGGSGVPLDENKYKKSVDFWSKNAIIK